MGKKILGVDADVYLLGIVSFLTDISSEAIFSVFSIFFTAVLGASTALLGLIEGLSDFASSSLDYLSGALSDRIGKRKYLAGIGYGFSTIAKVILVFSNTVILASLFRVIERLGKSFRGPPRDAWISSLVTEKNRGLSFGMHKALDKTGAIIGPLLAYFILSRLGENMHGFKVLFAIALIPAALAVVFLMFVKDKPSKTIPRENIFKSYKNMGKGYKHYLYTAGIFSIAYFSFGFLLLKAYQVGFSIKEVILLYAIFNISFVIVAAPIGKTGDIFGRAKIIYLGYYIYGIMSLGFIFAKTKFQVIALFILFGVFYAIDESQSKAYISQLETKRKGTALGLYNFITGLVYLPASLIGGFLWTLSPNYTFIFAGAIAAVAVIFFSMRQKEVKR